MSRTAKKSIAILDEGVVLVADADSIDFTGSGVTGSAIGNNVTESVSSSGDPTYSHGSGAPVSTPSAIGQGYIDDDTGNIYIAKGTVSSADWKLIASY